MEYIDIFDENNNPIDKVKEKTQAHEDGNFHRTAHIWIMNDKKELLLQKRSATKKSHPNCQDISGAGHIRTGESVIDGAIRELKEELGVEVEEKDLEYIATIKSTKNPKNMEFGYVYLLKCNNQVEEYIFEDNEVSEVKYVYFEELEKMVKKRVDGLLIHEEEYKKLFEFIRENYQEDRMFANKLKFGDTIGVIAPDKALKSKDIKHLENATKYFESLGLKVKYGRYLFSEDNYCAGTPEERAKDLNDMFSDKEVKAIFTVKGGDMVNGILPYIDFENIKNNPKIFLGMSDITVLLCAINKMTELITFHCQDYVWFGKDEVTDYDKNEIIDKLFNGNKTILPYEERQFINFKNKEIKGKIYGTNVRCLLKLLGTPYMPDLGNVVLFLEGFHSDIIQWNSMLE